MKIEILTNSLYEEYESFLLSCSYSLFYHSVKYKDFLEELLGCKSKYLLAYDKGKIVGALPLMIKEGPCGKVINSLPYYGSNGSIVSRSVAGHQVLLREYNSITAEKNIVSSTFIENPLDKKDASPLYNSLDVRIGQITKIKHIEACEKEIFKVLSGNRRNEIRKAQKNGVEVMEEVGQLDFIRTIHQNEMKKYNRKFKTDDFFLKVAHCFKEGTDYKVFIARQEGRPIAGLLMFYFNKVAEYFTPVILEEARIYQPMSLILYNVFVDAICRGYDFINWGGTWISQKGVYDFKSQLGAQDYSYNYYTQINNPDIFHYTEEEVLSIYPNFYVYNFNSRGLIK